MTDFKIGDEVVATEDGVEYKGLVTHVYDTYVTVDNKMSFFNAFVQLVKPATANHNCFKTGDIVQIKNDAPYYCFKKETVCKIIKRIKTHDDGTTEWSLESITAKPIRQRVFDTDFKLVTEPNILPKDTVVRRTNMPVRGVPIKAKGILTGKTGRTKDGTLLYHVNWFEYRICTYSRLENFEVVTEPEITYGKYERVKAAPDGISFEVSHGRWSGKKSHIQNLTLDDIAFAPYNDRFSATLHTPTKENTMSAKIITTHQVNIENRFYQTKELSTDQAAEIIRNQVANIKAFTDLPVKTIKIEEQIVELQADLDTFIAHMDSLAK